MGFPTHASGPHVAAYVRLAVLFRLADDVRFAVVFGLAAVRLTVLFRLADDVRFAVVFGLAAARLTVLFRLAADVRLGLAAISPPSSADTP